MPSPRLPGNNNDPSPARVQLEPHTTAQSLTRARGLTHRDLTLISYLARHRVLTAVQISRLLFGSETHARHRVTALHKQGVLARFRREVWPGSQAWRYTVGHVGAAVHAAATGAAFPRPSKVTEKIMRLAHSPHTDHLLGVNDFFTTLAGHARTREDCQLDQWWPEPITAEACAGIVRPDGYGEWRQHGSTLAFFVEYDNGTETLDAIIDKIRKYGELAHAVTRKPVLFLFTSTAREHHTHQKLKRHYSGGLPVPIATTSLDQPPNPDPRISTEAPITGRVWLRPNNPERQHLADLAHPQAPTSPSPNTRRAA